MNVKNLIEKIRSSKKNKGNYKSVSFWIGILLIVAGCMFIFGAAWIFYEFGPVSMESVIFQLNAPMVGTSNDYYFRFILRVIVPAVIIGLIIAALYVNRAGRKGVVATGIIFLITGIGYFSWEMNIGTYIVHQFTSTKIYDEYYVDPKKTEITFPEKKRNLIYIYMESMEDTYKLKENGGAMDENLIPRLTELEGMHIGFANDKGEQMHILPNCNWTIAAMTAQTCGVPLSIPFGQNSYSRCETFLPGICNLGDILEENGYKQELLIGTEKEFAGTDHMFTQHGNYEIMDYNKIIESKYVPEDYYKWWGIEDKTLYEIAKEELTKISQSGQPFNFTMATMDTHAKNGYYCKLCKSLYSTKYGNVIACADNQICDFVDWIQQQPFYENTTIIIVGDHCSMNDEFFDNISGNYTRTALNLIINPDVIGEVDQNRNYSSLDMFPTTLASLGVEIKGDRLGLGVNLFSEEETLLDKLGTSYLSDEILKKSKFYKKFLY